MCIGALFEENKDLSNELSVRLADWKGEGRNKGEDVWGLCHWARKKVDIGLQMMPYGSVIGAVCAICLPKAGDTACSRVCNIILESSFSAASKPNFASTIF